MKPTDALNSNFIGITNLHISGSLSAHHQEFLVVHRHWYIFADLMTVCYQEQDGTSCSWNLKYNVINYKFAKCILTLCVLHFLIGARGSVVVKALRY